MLLLHHKSLSSKAREGRYDTFLAGLIGGYAVFGRGSQSSVNQQIVIYVFARVVLALAKLTVQQPGDRGYGMGRVMVMPEGWKKGVARNAWPVFAGLSWGAVMWLFRWYPETLQPSLRSSMKYMYVSLPFFCSPLCCEYLDYMALGVGSWNCFGFVGLTL